MKRDDDLTTLLDQLDDLFGRYVSFPTEEARWSVAAWTMHTWAVKAFDSSPRLALLSPEKGSGKTRTLEVLELVVPGPLLTVNISAAAMFRMVADGNCTLLLDEADTYLGPKVSQQHEDLRGLINAGHRRGAVAYRATPVGKQVKVEAFPAFAPAALAGIGDLPDTILDRSVLIAMRRRAPGEIILPFRRRSAERETEELRQWLETWADDDRNLAALESAEPAMPGGLTDRPADVWEALVAIGDRAGGEWSDRIRTAAVALNEARSKRDPSLGIMLLSDCRRVFADLDRLSTDELLEALNGLDDAPWGDLRGKPLDSRGLARRIRKYEVRPGDHRFGNTVKKGYRRVDFHDAWVRYLPQHEGNSEAPKGNTSNGTTPDVAHVADEVGDVIPHKQHFDASRSSLPLFIAEDGQQGQHEQHVCASPGCIEPVDRRGQRCVDHSFLRPSTHEAS